MKRMGRKGLSLLLVVVLLSICLTACGKSMEDQLADSWYPNGHAVSQQDGGKGPAFTLYSDGTCKIAGEYGTGHWSVVNDNQLKLTNYYGESETVTIVSVEDGCLTLEGDMVCWNKPIND